MFPQRCSPELAQKSLEKANKIKFIKHIRHLTKVSALTSIFDDGLYGRKTLLQFLLPF